jgi:SAM-dependent methyltransferase
MNLPEPWTPPVARPPRARNALHYWAGLAILVLNKIRHTLKGYVTPRTFPISQIDRAVQYDFQVVDEWLQWLQRYTGRPALLEGKTVLELGPGEDLGVGLLLLARGAREYRALDVHPLAEGTPQVFYDRLLERIAEDPPPGAKLEELCAQLRRTQAKMNDRLNYVCSNDFSLSVFPNNSVDLIFSQAAFEHFDSMERTVAELSETARPGAVLVALIDLKTHTRWIGDRDPLNIYRYGDRLYNALRFSGSPNRLRPDDYTGLFERQGWRDVVAVPSMTLEPAYVRSVQPSLHGRFRDPVSRMEPLGIWLCATRS